MYFKNEPAKDVEELFNLAAKLQKIAIRDQGVKMSEYPYNIEILKVGDNSQLMFTVLNAAKNKQHRRKLIQFFQTIVV